HHPRLGSELLLPALQLLDAWAAPVLILLQLGKLRPHLCALMLEKTLQRRQVREVKTEERDEDEHAAQERVQEELDGGILAPRPAPDADEEVHRQQHHFPEDIEQEEVQRQEGAHHACFQEQKQDQVTAHVLFNLPAREDSQEAQARR